MNGFRSRPLSVKAEEAANAGIRSIEHLANYEVLGECSAGETYSPSSRLRLFDKLAAKGVWQTPTLAFEQTLPDAFEGKRFYCEVRTRQHCGRAESIAMYKSATLGCRTGR